MEPIKKNSTTLSRIKWQWKSNSDPFTDTEEPQWTDYSSEQKYLLEKAYQSEKKEVDFGKYIVSVQHMIQSKKENRTLQRPIRRITCEDDDMIFRSERYFETELPKTINKIFGNLGHFISFFSKRNPDILKLTELFHQIDESKDLNGLNTEILSQLISCLEKELLIPIDEQLKDASLTAFQKKTKLKIRTRHEELISLFRKDFVNFEEFYGKILKSYTMATDLYLNLNKYLRNENWRAIDNLLPYTICLCKAFFSLKLDKNSQKEDENTLYRGTALDEFTLKSYQTEKGLKFFSWNSVTSTTKNPKMAEKFMLDSVDFENKKYPVLFIIEIPVAEELIESEYLKWIDICQYSAMPNEDEVIIAPGSAYELVNSFTDENTKITTINLKLKHEIESLAHGGLIMQGAFQNEMMNDKQAKIMCLEGEELSGALRNISGNSLIEEIEFCLCSFDHKSVKEMLETLPTLEKTKVLKIIACKYEDEHGISSVQLKEMISFNIRKIEITEARDLFHIFRMGKEGEKCWRSLRTLSVDFRHHGVRRMQEANDSVFQRLGGLTQLTSLILNFSNCYQITNEEMSNLAFQGLKPLIQLTSLTIDFSWCKRIMDQGVNSLASHGLQYLNQLTSLTLDFSWCPGITNQGVSALACRGLKDLTHLTFLSLDFTWDEQITDDGVLSLACGGLKYLVQLTSLTLNFSWCKPLTNEGVKHLASQGLKYLTQLTSLTINCSNCSKVTNEGVYHLASEGLKYVTHLTSLSLDFSWDEKINDEGVVALVFEGLIYLIQLNFLKLTFLGCKQITHEEVNDLASQGLEDLTQLACFIFNDKMIKQTCNHHEIDVKQEKPIVKKFSMKLIRKTEKKLKSLLSEPLASILPSEKSASEMTVSSQSLEGSKESLDKFFFGLLNLEWNSNMRKDPFQYTFFSSCIKNSQEKSTDKVGPDLSVFSPKAGLLLSLLTCLTLDFVGFSKISKEEVATLASEGLKSLTQLTSLTLHFSRGQQITDEGVSALATEGLQYLTQLTSLSLGFSWDEEITNHGVTNLTSQGLRYLSQLTFLSLNFNYCKQITDTGVTNLAFQGVKYLTRLTSLTLIFSGCKRITNVEMMNLASHGLKNLTQLSSLCLYFDYSKITDEGVNALTYQGLKYLRQLTSLSLSFERCDKITDKGLNYLASKALKNLNQLTSLVLDLSGCLTITNVGVNDVACQGLKHLTQLTSLHLIFNDCKQITDEGVNNLILHIIKYLIGLTALTLHFTDSTIDNFTSSNIFRVLHYFGFIPDDRKRF